MLTQACNKIESNMLGGSISTNKINHKTTSSGSPRQSPPKRSRPLEISDSEEGPSSASPPSNKQPRLHSTSPKQDLAKVSQPLASNEVKRSTPEQRPRPTSVSSLSSLSPTARASSQSLYGVPPMHPGLAGHFPHHPMLPPGYPGLPPHLAGLPTPRPPACPPSHCTNPMCTDMTCQTGAARASFLMGVPPHPSLNLLNLMHPPPPNPADPAQPPPTTSPYVCNWMSGADFCGRRFSTSEDLMSHLRTHTASAASTSAPAPASTAHPAVTAALAQALMSTAPMVTSTSTTSALAALQAQAVKLATAPSRSPVATPTAPPTTTPTTTSATAAWAAAAAAANSADLANAAAARYHAALSTTRPAFPPSFGIPPGALPPHLASLYGLGNPYGSLQQQQLQMLYQMP